MPPAGRTVSSDAETGVTGPSRHLLALRTLFAGQDTVTLVLQG